MTSSPASGRAADPAAAPKKHGKRRASRAPGPPVDHCAICAAFAPYGFGVHPLDGKPGSWACAAHRSEVEAMTEADLAHHTHSPPADAPRPSRNEPPRQLTLF